MKALSIKQPWAHLIVHGIKDIENRSWNTKYRGPFLVHAGKGFDQDGFDRAMELMNHYGLDPWGIPMEAKDFERGGIVGQAEIVDCIPPGSAHQNIWYEGQYGFLLVNASRLPFRPYKGALGFFEITP